MQQDASEGAADVPSQDTVLDEEEVDLNLPACSLFLPSLSGAAAFLPPWSCCLFLLYLRTLGTENNNNTSNSKQATEADETSGQQRKQSSYILWPCCA